jgi:hypothetical protein
VVPCLICRCAAFPYVLRMYVSVKRQPNSFCAVFPLGAACCCIVGAKSNNVQSNNSRDMAKTAQLSLVLHRSRAVKQSNDCDVIVL